MPIDPGSERLLASLEKRVSGLEARDAARERSLRGLRERLDRQSREIAEMSRAEEIARGVAAELARREDRQQRRLSSAWIKLGIAGVAVGAALGIIQFALIAAGAR